MPAILFCSENLILLNADLLIATEDKTIGLNKNIKDFFLFIRNVKKLIVNNLKRLMINGVFFFVIKILSIQAIYFIIFIISNL